LQQSHRQMDLRGKRHTYRCVEVCCSVLQCVAVCCSVLLCVAVCYSMLQYVAAISPADGPQRQVSHVLLCCSVLQCVAVCGSMLQQSHRQMDLRGKCHTYCYVAVCCSVLQCVGVCCSNLTGRWASEARVTSAVRLRASLYLCANSRCNANTVTYARIVAHIRACDMTHSYV